MARAPKPKILFDGKCTIFRADCADVLPRLPKRMGPIFTDAPFEKRMHDAKAANVKTRKIRTDGHAELKRLDFSSIDDLRPIITPLMAEVCRGWMLIFCTPEGIAPWRDAIEAAGAKYKRACFWCKTDAAPQFNGQGPSFAVEPFVTAWCGGGVSKWNGGGQKNWWPHQTNNEDREGTHPAEKPLGLMIKLVELFSKPGDIIIDPFMGSATTGIAALSRGRQFVGIESDPEHFKLGEARLRSIFMGRTEAKTLIAKMLGGAEAGPLFTGAQ